MRHRVTVALLVVAAIGVGACSGDDGAGRDPSDDGQGPGVTAEVKSATLFATHRSLRLAVANTTADPVDLGAVQLSSSLFEPVEPEVRDVVLDAGGGRVVMPLPFGRARCTAGGGSAAPGASSGVLVATVDGDETRIPLGQSPADLLAEMHRSECAADEVLAAVDMRLGDRWTAAGPRAIAGEVTVARRAGDVEARLDEVLGNVIFAFDRATDGEPPWLTIDDAEPSAAVPVVVRAARCDAHALIEYKRTFVFVAVVSVDGAPPVRVDLTAEDGARRALETLLASCIG